LSLVKGEVASAFKVHPTSQLQIENIEGIWDLGTISVLLACDG
jgi:hypothetical protein